MMTGTRWPCWLPRLPRWILSLTAEAISAAARRVFSKPAHLQKLAWAVEGNPSLLTGGGIPARVPRQRSTLMLPGVLSVSG